MENIDLNRLNERIEFNIGLVNALQKTAWLLADIPKDYWNDFNSVLALCECLRNGLEYIHDVTKEVA